MDGHDDTSTVLSVRVPYRTVQYPWYSTVGGPSQNTTRHGNSTVRTKPVLYRVFYDPFHYARVTSSYNTGIHKDSFAGLLGTVAPARQYDHSRTFINFCPTGIPGAHSSTAAPRSTYGIIVSKLDGSRTT